MVLFAPSSVFLGMQMAKPTGVDGPIKVYVSAGGVVTGGFEQIPFSKSKSDIEIAMAQAFIRSMNRELDKVGEKFILSNPLLNSEADFDITVTTSRGDAYLEMREIQPGVPYNRAESRFFSYQFAQLLRSAVSTKAAHYGRHPGREFFLLLYSTHWAFRTNETCRMCLRYWLMRDQPLFNAVFSYHPLDANEGVGHWLHPYPPELLGTFDPETVRDHWCINFNPSMAIVSPLASEG